jgi:hypothetical protein
MERARVPAAKWLICAAALASVVGVPNVDSSEPDGTIGPDVVVFSLPDTYDWGTSDGIRAYSVGTTSCNRGDQPLSWFSSTNEHPVIAQNLYRITLPDAGPPVEHGSIEMLGISWLKHGFYSVNGGACGSCVYPPAGGSQLGVGCSDPYDSGLNGSYSSLGPRSEVNAFTGYFELPHASPTGSSTIRGRIQVDETMIVDDPTRYRYFVEGQYVAADDAAAGRGLNNASHREVLVSGTSLAPTGVTVEKYPAIYAWQTVDPAVTVQFVDIPGEGRIFVAHKVGDNLDGTWHYRYAVFNLNSHLSGRSFSVPILPTSLVTDAAFSDVDYHSGEPYDGTDWPVDIDLAGGSVSWSTESHAANPLANALRWSTMYTFSFDADGPPEAALATIGLFRDGGPSAVTALVEAPASNLIPMFADDFETGGFGGWSVVVP